LVSCSKMLVYILVSNLWDNRLQWLATTRMMKATPAKLIGTASCTIWELGYKSLYSDWAAGWMIQRTISGRVKGLFSSSEHPQLYRGPTVLPFNDYWKFFPWRQSNSGVKLTTHFHLEPRLRKSGDTVFTLIIKPNRRTNFSQIYYWNKTLRFGWFLCPSSGVFHCTHSNGICHTCLLTACKQEEPSKTCRVLFQ